MKYIYLLEVARPSCSKASYIIKHFSLPEVISKLWLISPVTITDRA